MRHGLYCLTRQERLSEVRLGAAGPAFFGLRLGVQGPKQGGSLLRADPAGALEAHEAHGSAACPAQHRVSQ